MHLDRVDHCMLTLMFGGLMWIWMFRREKRTPQNVQRNGCLFLLALFVVSMFIGAWAVWAVITRL